MTPPTIGPMGDPLLLELELELAAELVGTHCVYEQELQPPENSSHLSFVPHDGQAGGVVGHCKHLRKSDLAAYSSSTATPSIVTSHGPNSTERLSF